MSFRVLGTGMYVPPRVVTNDDLSQFLETNDEWITQRVGVKERHISTNETAADMGAKAARAALENSGVAAEEIDLILAASVSGESISPSVSCMIQNLLGLSCMTMDINAACSAFDFLLETAHIRNILRMHFVQLLLKKFDLLPDSGLPVNFLIGVLLRSLSFLTDTENLHQLIDSLFHQMHAFFPGIHLDHMVFFFPGKAHVTSQGTDGFRIAFPMVDHASYPDAPLKAFCKIHQFFLDLIKFLLFFFIKLYSYVFKSRYQLPKH